MNRLNLLFRAVTLTLLLLLASCPLWAQLDSTLWRNTEKVARTLFYIHNYYVDTVDMDRIVDEVLDDLMEHLDPHSSYLAREKAAATQESLDGSFEGVGVEFAIVADTLTVQAVIPGGPCEAAGILPGDRILEVDGEEVPVHQGETVLVPASADDICFIPDDEGMKLLTSYIR